MNGNQKFGTRASAPGGPLDVDDPLNWWEPCHLLFLAIVSAMPAQQQAKIKQTLHEEAELRDAKGDVLAGSFMHALADDPVPNESPPRLICIQGGVACAQD
jgi:hypothetical protein